MDEITAMKLALAEAAKGAPFVSPNPPVGCVVLDAKGEFLKSGYHRVYGGPHAEVDALEGLTHEQLKDAHVIVTLEPCAHEGKTPSCAKMLAKLPIKKVTFGLVDPNPLVAGQGVEILKQAGKEVIQFRGLQDELEEVCEAFLKNFKQKKIFTAVKVATSLDGQMALKSGESKWITGEPARQMVHYMRACFDAILVGAGTVRIDNPSLNIRHPGIQKSNKVVVLDPQGEHLKNFPNLKLSRAHRLENIFWCVSSDTSVEPNSKLPKVLKIKAGSEGFDYGDLLEQLWNEGIRSLMIEGGAYTISGFIKAKAVDRIYVFIAPHLMGAGGSQSWTKFLSLSSMDQRLALKQMKTQQVGQDLLITAKF